MFDYKNYLESLVSYTNNLNNLYGYNAYNDQLSLNQKTINNVYTEFKNQKIEINLDKVTIDTAIKELTIDMGKAQEHIKALEQLAKDAAVKETSIDKISKDLNNNQDNFTKNVNDYNIKYENSLASNTWAENRLEFYNSLDPNSINADNFIFQSYMIEKYGTFGEDGNPFEMDVSELGISPEVLAMEKVGFLIFKDAYKGLTIAKLNEIKNKNIITTNTTPTTGDIWAGGGGGGGSSSGSGSGSASSGGFAGGLGWGGGFAGSGAAKKKPAKILIGDLEYIQGEGADEFNKKAEET